MQIKQKLSKQIMSLSNGYINKGPQRVTVTLPNPEERSQKPTCRPQAHNVLQILSCQSIYDGCSFPLILGNSCFNAASHTHPAWLLTDCECTGPKVLLFSAVVLVRLERGTQAPGWVSALHFHCCHLSPSSLVFLLSLPN